jgi:2-polyprenyl-3-methyl-5-hydroxy-6-metoxy-1,4-benzoquinol methylase
VSDRRTSESYWSHEWSTSDLPAPIPAGGGSRLSDHVNATFHRYFVEHLLPIAPRGSRLLEVGCARSAWLPYFHRELGYEVAGIDYSEVGCAQARVVLEREGVTGTVVCRDLFDPTPELVGGFDVVFSRGVVEHFDDTAACIDALATYLRPGGVMLTIVPNLAGAIGLVQRLVNRPVYDMHVPIDRDQLAAAHRAAGLDVVRSEYVLPANFGVNNLNDVRSGTPSWLLKRGVLAVLVRVSMATWWLERRGIRIPRSRLFSPYAFCLATR